MYALYCNTNCLSFPFSHLTVVIFLCVAPSYTGFKVSHDSETTNDDIEFNN